jgi:hypothetical protein
MVPVQERSRARKTANPTIVQANTSPRSDMARVAAGSMWKNAPPSSEPAASATSGVTTRRIVGADRRRARLPTSAMALIASPLPTIHQNVFTAGGQPQWWPCPPPQAASV